MYLEREGRRVGCEGHRVRCEGGRVRRAGVRVFVLIVGAGRVGSAVAKSALAAGHEVSVLDEDPLSHERLDAGQGRSWEDAEGQFTVGTALETEALIAAGIERADVFIASTDGDNTNLIIAQIAQKRFGVGKVIVRVMDPARASWYGEQGLHTISPTKHAIEMFERALAPEGAA
jgi:trk system potassium uptake protein TrkA